MYIFYFMYRINVMLSINDWNKNMHLSVCLSVCLTALLPTKLKVDISCSIRVMSRTKVNYSKIRKCRVQYGSFALHFYSMRYIYTSISIASLSFTGRMKFIPRWTPLALSPRKGTENTNDVSNSPLFLECCYFKIASTRCKAILIASPIFFVFLNKTSKAFIVY